MTNMPVPQNRAIVQGSNSGDEVEARYFVESDSGGFSLGQILRMLRRHVWLILCSATLAVAAAAYLSSGETTTYMATAVIRLIERRSSVGETVTEVPLGRVDPLMSEMMVLRGRTVLGEVVDREGMRLASVGTAAPASFVQEVEIDLPPEERGAIHLEFGDAGITYGPEGDRRTAAYGEPIVVEGARFVVPEPQHEGSADLRIMPRDVAIDYLQGGLNAEPEENTGGVNVTFVSEDPDLPTRAVNAIVEVYQEVNADLARENYQRRREYLEEQLRTTDSLLMVAQTGLSSFRTQEQTYSVAGEFSAEQGNLIQVEMQQAQLQAQLGLYRNLLSRIEQLRSSGQSSDLNAWISLPGIASDPVVGQVYSQLVGYHTERESMLAGPWGRAASHPEVQRLNVLISSTEQRLADAVQGQINSLQAQISSLGGLRGRALGKMSDLPRTEVQEMYLTQNLESLRYLADQLRDQYQAARLEEAAEAGVVHIVQLASRALPTRPSPWLKMLLGLMTGLALGVAMALLREKMDQSISTPEDIEEMLLIPNLAVIPQASAYLEEAPRTNGGNSRFRSADEPQGAEAFRILRTNLLFSQGGLKTLVVTSAAPGEGKTMTAVNLAAALARQGLRVLLMECDLRRPSLARHFEVQDGKDLASVLLENRSWQEAIQPSEVPGLDILLAGQYFPRAAEFLAGAEMKQLLDELAAHYDMVILDTSPLLVAADATVLGAIADGVLLVVKATQTDRSAVQQAVHQLTLVGAHIVGTVLNDPDGSVARYGSYYDYSAEYEAR